MASRSKADPGSIARNWTPEEALTFTAFLDELAAMIWNMHGDRMVPLILRDMVPEPPESTAPTIDDSDVPF